MPHPCYSCCKWPGHLKFYFTQGSLSFVHCSTMLKRCVALQAIECIISDLATDMEATSLAADDEIHHASPDSKTVHNTKSGSASSGVAPASTTSHHPPASNPAVSSKTAMDTRTYQTASNRCDQPHCITCTGDSSAPQSADSKAQTDVPGGGLEVPEGESPRVTQAPSDDVNEAVQQQPMPRGSSHAKHTSSHQARNVQEGSKQKEQKPIGRNQPCPCGSHKKFKACCGRQRPAQSMPAAPAADDARAKKLQQIHTIYV